MIHPSFPQSNHSLPAVNNLDRLLLDFRRIARGAIRWFSAGSYDGEPIVAFLDHWCVFITRVFKPWIATSCRRQHEFGTTTRTEPDSHSAALFDVNDVGVNPADLWRVRQPHMEFLTWRDDRMGYHK